jgi:hypothetical protein
MAMAWVSDEVRQLAGQAGLVAADGAAANADRDRRVVAEDATGEDAAALGVAAVGDADDRPVIGDGAVAEVQAPLGAIDPAADGVRGDACGPVIADLGVIEREGAPVVYAACAELIAASETPLATNRDRAMAVNNGVVRLIVPLSWSGAPLPVDILCKEGLTRSSLIMDGN